MGNGRQGLLWFLLFVGGLAHSRTIFKSAGCYRLTGRFLDAKDKSFRLKIHERSRSEKTFSIITDEAPIGMTTGMVLSVPVYVDAPGNEDQVKLSTVVQKVSLVPQIELKSTEIVKWLGKSSSAKGCP
jgi:hypothetical protein